MTLATCADLPDLDPDEAGLPDALRERGLEPRIAVWNDPSVDWNAAGVVVVRSVRDYAVNREAFLAWARSVPRLLNQAGLMSWNSDKHYLAELARRWPSEADSSSKRCQVVVNSPVCGRSSAMRKPLSSKN